MKNTKNRTQLMVYVIKTMFNDYLSRKSKKVTLLLLLLMAITIGIYQLEPLIVARIISADDKAEALQLIFLMAILVIINGGIKFASMYLRELQWGIDYVQLRMRLSRAIWIEKSVHQVLSGKDEFNVSYIEKVLHKMEEILNRMRFGVFHDLLSLVIAFTFLVKVSMQAAIVMSVYIVIHSIWAIWANGKVFEPLMKLEEQFKELSSFMSERWQNPQVLMRSGVAVRELDKLEERMKKVVTEDRRIWAWYGMHSEIRLTIGALFLLASLAFLITGTISVVETALLFPTYMYMQSLLSKVWRIDEVQRFMTRYSTPIQQGHEMASKPITIRIAPHPSLENTLLVN